MIPKQSTLHWIVIYPVDRVIRFFNNRRQNANFYLDIFLLNDVVREGSFFEGFSV